MPQILDKSAYDEVKTVTNETAYETCRNMARREGMLVGISSAASISVAIDLAEKTGENVIVVAPDSGERYLSVEGLF